MASPSFTNVSFARLDKLSWGIIIWNVEPQAMRNRGGDTLAKAERVATDEISTIGERVIKGIKEIGCGWVKKKTKPHVKQNIKQLEDTMFTSRNGTTYKAVIINGEDILLLGNHVTKATTSGILERDARSLRTQNLVNVVTIVEIVTETTGDLDGFGRIAILNDDQMIGLEEGPPHFKKIEVSDGGYDDIEVIFERRIGGRHERKKNRGKRSIMGREITTVAEDVTDEIGSKRKSECPLERDQQANWTRRAQACDPSTVGSEELSQPCKAKISTKSSLGHQFIDEMDQENDGYGSGLTYSRIRSQWFVVKAENLSEIVEVGMLDDQIPLGVIHPKAICIAQTPKNNDRIIEGNEISNHFAYIKRISSIQCTNLTQT
ncbi:hypothetical protein Ccrd_012560 [Cynara cardunculus var. scolymus]|uniref:Uncharacterized protein n=1 Tax=Cynara cardunculus var. scolymus TaxID=59895 RepID=A0A103YH89_CYNCS|nr:hypothetical protein Ccrd_012560 [Cynara cardunculus var. scolymus]